MSACPRFTHLLVLPHLRVQNANAVSGPLTHGFPSITAFLGLMQALERKAVDVGVDRMAFNAVGVVSHGWQELVSEGGFVKSFRLTRNPVDKDGSTAAIVEEGRIHLELSLVFALTAEDWDEDRRQTDVTTLAQLLSCMRIAGGSVSAAEKPWQRRHQPFLADFTGGDEDRRKSFREACLRLLPGSALVGRDALLEQQLTQLRVGHPGATRLDAWLSLSRVDWRYDANEDDGKGGWQSSRRKGDGWIVPIPVGYGAISDLYPAGSVAHARDATTLFRFVESLYSLGEWIGPHRLQRPQDLLWYVDRRPEDGLYRCRNDYRPADTMAGAASV